MKLYVHNFGWSGAIVWTAENLEEAIAKYNEHRPHNKLNNNSVISEYEIDAETFIEQDGE